MAWGPGATPLVGVEGAKPPKLMDFSLLKTHLEGSSGTDFLAFCLFFVFPGGGQGDEAPRSSWVLAVFEPQEGPFQRVK